MDESKKRELFSIVLKALKYRASDNVAMIIEIAHGGRPSRFITMGNMHLFRLYRNDISASGAHLVDAARESSS